MINFKKLLNPSVVLLLTLSNIVVVPASIKEKPHVGRADQNRLRRFERQLDELRTLLRIPGMSAVIVRDQKVLWAKGFGYADLEKKIPASPDTPYHIASLTKTFAATLLMQFVEQGKLSLDEPMSKYSSEFKDDSVKIKHVLSHTSQGTPGERYQYSGRLYDFLTKVIEKVSGKPFREVLVRTILDPLGMTDSVPGHDVLSDKNKSSVVLGKENTDRYERVLSRFAQPYRLYGTETVHTPYPPDNIGAAAGLISTVMDLARYDAAIDRHAFIKQETQEKAWTPTISNSGKPLPYGLGWFTETYHSMKLIWHFGDWTNSFSALMLKIPDRNISFYVLANSDALSEPAFFNSTGVEGSPFACTFLRLFVFEQLQNATLADPHWSRNAHDFSAELARLRRQSKGYEYTCETIAHDAIFKWIEERRASAQREVAIDWSVYASYVGQYGGRPDGTGGFIVSSVVAKPGSTLWVDVPRNGKFEMFPESETKFFLKGMDLQLTFIKDDTGQVTHMDFQAGEQKGRVKKVR